MDAWLDCFLCQDQAHVVFVRLERFPSPVLRFARHASRAPFRLQARSDAIPVLQGSTLTITQFLQIHACPAMLGLTAQPDPNCATLLVRPERTERTAARFA